MAKIMISKSWKPSFIISVPAARAALFDPAPELPGASAQME
jgi:hypothetical protein